MGTISMLETGSTIRVFALGFTDGSTLYESAYDALTAELVDRPDNMKLIIHPHEMLSINTEIFANSRADTDCPINNLFY